MQHKAKPASGSKTPAQPKPDALGHFTAATLQARLGELREHMKRVTAEVIRLEGAHVQPTALEDERQHDTRRAGLALLCGGNETINEAFALQDVQKRMALLHRQYRDLQAAIEAAEVRVNILTVKEQHERWTAAKPQYRERVRAVWKALVELDKAQAERDAFIRELRVKPDVEAGCGWPLAGRLGRTESQTYRYGRVLVDIGALSETEFQKAYTNAKI